MKVFYQHTTESYSGGVRLIAANDVNEAREIAMSEQWIDPASLTDVIEAESMCWDGDAGVLPFSSIYFEV